MPTNRVHDHAQAHNDHGGAHSYGGHHHHHAHAHHHHHHDGAHSCGGHHHAHEHHHAREARHSCGAHHHEAPACGSNQQQRAPSPSPTTSESISPLQAKVREVMRSDLSQTEKQARIHAIFLEQRSPITAQSRVWKSSVLSADNFPGLGASAGCQHYERKCWIRAECCKKYYPCRRCHDEAETHEINRAEIQFIACTVCGDKDQPLSPTCRTCGVRFARYFCKPCKMYNDSADRDCFHCNKCGICRVGLEEDNYHCDDCGTCMPKERRYDHPCRTKNLESNCPICHEHLATTTEEIFVLQCTHPIHAKCFDQYAQAGNFSCPLCCKAIFDQKIMQDWYRKIDERIALDKMPEEFEKKMSEVFCNDCETKTTTKFHFRFHKCKDCNGYNTTVLNQFDRDTEDTTNSDDTDMNTDDTDMNTDGTPTPNDTEDEGGGASTDQESPPRSVGTEEKATSNCREKNINSNNHNYKHINNRIQNGNNSEKDMTLDNL